MGHWSREDGLKTRRRWFGLPVATLPGPGARAASGMGPGVRPGPGAGPGSSARPRWGIWCLGHLCGRLCLS